MKIDKQKEEQLEAISEAAKHLESLIEQLWIDDGNRNNIGLPIGSILTIYDSSTEKEQELTLSDCADFKLLKEAYLRA